MSWLKKLKSELKRDVKKRKSFHHPSLAKELKRIRIFLDEKRDINGWILDDCDAMLYQGLYGAITKEKATIFAAQVKGIKGRFNRRPKNDCLSTNESKSTWSRDMGLGLMWWCYRAKNHKALNEHFSYCQKHKGRMGDGVYSRIFYTPQFASLLDQVRFAAKNRDYPWYKRVRYIYTEGLDGYQAHLMVLVIALYGEMYGKIPYRAFERLKEHSDRKPHNPLYAAVYARFGGSVKRAFDACLAPDIDDYAGGKHKDIMQASDRLFAIDYLTR